MKTLEVQIVQTYCDRNTKLYTLQARQRPKWWPFWLLCPWKKFAVYGGLSLEQAREEKQLALDNGIVETEIEFRAIVE